MPREAAAHGLHRRALEMIDLLDGPIWTRLLITHDLITNTLVDQIVDAITRALTAPAGLIDQCVRGPLTHSPAKRAPATASPSSLTAADANVGLGDRGGAARTPTDGSRAAL